MMKLVTFVNSAHRRDYPVADTTLIDPTEVDALVDGEWLSLDPSANLVRANSNDAGAYMLFTSKGSTDAQSLGKVCVIMSRDFEVDTDMFLATDSYAIGDEVGISQEVVDGATRCVFRPVSVLTAGTDYSYGVVTLDPDNNNDQLRVHCHSPHLI